MTGHNLKEIQASPSSTKTEHETYQSSEDNVFADFITLKIHKICLYIYF